MTLASIQDPEFLISDDGTFLYPGVSDESNNWANRGGLLTAYRKLRVLVAEQDIDTLP